MWILFRLCVWNQKYKFKFLVYRYRLAKIRCIVFLFFFFDKQQNNPARTHKKNHMQERSNIKTRPNASRPPSSSSSAAAQLQTAEVKAKAHLRYALASGVSMPSS